MKKLYMILSLAALVLAGASCERENLGKNGHNGENGGEKVFYATLENASGTRTTIGPGYKVCWENTDTISINGVMYVATPAAPNSARAEFKKASNETKEDPSAPYTVYYPASIYDGTAATLPATQVFAHEGSLAGVLPMYAYSETETETNEFEFKNLCGLLKLTISGNQTLSDIVVSDEAQEPKPLCGKFVVKDNAAVIDDPEAGTKIKLDFGEEGVQLDSAGTDFYIALPAGSYDKLRIDYNTDNSAYVGMTAGGAATLERNKIYPFNETPRGNWFYVEALEKGTVVLYEFGESPEVNLEYSKDKGETWNDLIVKTPVDVAENDKIFFRAKEGGNKTFATSGTDYNSLWFQNRVNVGGNIMYLLDGQNPGMTLSEPYTFSHLFSNSGIVSAENLILPATTLSTSCYSQLFLNNAKLAVAPSLPAEELQDCCYFEMFMNCEAMVSAPELPAKIMKNSCYRGMFAFSGLLTAPVLPAAELKDSCYMSMFYRCENLTSAPDLKAASLAPYCYSEMFLGCNSLKDASPLPAMTMKKRCYEYMYSYCNALEKAPELPSKSLAEGCYRSMFSSCTSLTEVPVLPATEMENNCYDNMFCECSNIKAVPDTLLPAKTLADYCYLGMFYGCSSLKNAPELPAETLTPLCYESMFGLCTSLTKAPVLPAKTLAECCYLEMFNGCTKLNYIKCLATEMVPFSTDDWVSNVSSAGIFVKANDQVSWSTGASGIPQGWTAVTQDYPVYEEGDYVGLGVKVAGLWWAPVNCGYDTEKSPKGLFYQWGKKQSFATEGPIEFSKEQMENMAAGINRTEFFIGNECWYKNPTTVDTWPVDKDYDPCPEGWRVPTIDEFKVLVTASYKWITDGKIAGKGAFSGMRFPATGDNYIFLPVSGGRDYPDTKVYEPNCGFYWSSSPVDNILRSTSSEVLLFDSSKPSLETCNTRGDGLSVRCIKVDAKSDISIKKDQKYEHADW